MLHAFRFPKITKRDLGCLARIGNAVQLRGVGIVSDSIRGAYGNAPRATVAFVVPPPRCFIPLRRRLLLSLAILGLSTKRLSARIHLEPHGTTRSGMPALNARAGPAPGDTREWELAGPELDLHTAVFASERIRCSPSYCAASCPSAVAITWTGLLAV
jgi:hypothetical protein